MDAIEPFTMDELNNEVRKLNNGKCRGTNKVFAEMNDIDNGKCVFPQIHHMDRLYQDSPNATWIMPFRNTTDWLRSVTNWGKGTKRGSLAEKFDRVCGWSEFRPDNANREEDVARFVCNHVREVRQFVKDHPSLSLVEFNINDSNAGNILADVFPIVEASHWGQHNKGK